jgi:hypothetical protein
MSHRHLAGPIIAEMNFAGRDALEAFAVTAPLGTETTQPKSPSSSSPTSLASPPNVSWFTSTPYVTASSALQQLTKRRPSVSSHS